MGGRYGIIKKQAEQSSILHQLCADNRLLVKMAYFFSFKSVVFLLLCRSLRLQATVQAGEARIIATCPVRHTEVDCLFNVQVIVFADWFPSAGTKAPAKNPKLKNIFCLPAFMPGAC